jgi:hypothetical protein
MSRYPLNLYDGPPSIGIFHRSGDFKAFLNPEELDDRAKRTQSYGYLPAEYAADALRFIRNLAGYKVPAVLSTDADLYEVKSILEQGNVSLARTDSSFANMLEMSRHRIHILGTSSYGRWSYFLGDSFGIFPKSHGVDNSFAPLGIPSRNGAWFIYDDDTQLNDSSVADSLKKYLI